jgi:hypothetical protein
MLDVAFTPIMLSVIMLNVVMLTVVAPYLSFKIHTDWVLSKLHTIKIMTGGGHIC